MEQIGFLDLEQKSSTPNSDITGFNQDEREFAVVGVYDGAVFIDITNPANPDIVGKISGSNSSVCRHVHPVARALSLFQVCAGRELLGERLRHAIFHVARSAGDPAALHSQIVLSARSSPQLVGELGVCRLSEWQLV